MIVNNRGFTLVELLITIVVLGIVATTISSLFLTIQQTQRRTNFAETANRAGIRQIESLRNQNYNSLTPGETINFTDELPSTLPNDRTGIIEISEPIPGLRRVDTTITYTFGGSEQTIRLSSLIGVIGITQ